ncbi:MAG: hypothetical protein ACOC7T_03085 [Planctomycetota bacterium]
MDYVAIFHANLNYAFLEPFFFERVIRASYETIIDVFRERCPKAKYVFEASGYTVEHIAKVCPDVFEKLKDAVERGQCEFMGSPYAHPILANVPEEDGRWANEFAMRVYEEYLGFRPQSGWNPECTWRQYVPRTFRDVGYEHLTLDFESYKISTDKDYGWIERNRGRNIYWGGHLPEYPLHSDDPALHRPFRNVVDGLDGMCRSDRLAGRSIGYFLGSVPLEDYIENIERWSGDVDEGALIIVADDAEYCGTRGYYDVKHYGDYSKCFGVVPEAADRLEAMVNAVMDLGDMITFAEACRKEPVDEPFFVEDGMAWHRTYAEVWGSTPEAKRFDPQLDIIRRDYKENVHTAAEGSERHRELVEEFWYHLTCAANSDGRWPPPPRKTSPYHRRWVQREIDSAREALEKLKSAVGRTGGEADQPEAESATKEVQTREFSAEELPELNLKELQDALYYAHDLNDAAATEEEGAGLIRAVFDEYEKRGFVPHDPPRIKGE